MVHAGHANQDQKRTIMTMAAMGLIMILAFAHMSSWGRHSGRIIYLKAAAFTGIASANDYSKLIAACTDTGRYDCAADAYLYLYQETHNPEVVGELATFYSKTGNFKASAAAFVKYYQLDGKNPKLAYFYGQALEKTGETERALNAYKMSIDQNPEMLSLNATKSLVKLLMDLKRNQEAYDTIAKFHASAQNAKGHLTSELRALSKLVSNHSASKRQIASVRSETPRTVVRF